MARVKISPDDCLYRRVQRIHLKKDGTFSDGVFGTFELSADLAKLTTPQETFERGAPADPGSDQEYVGVISFAVRHALDKGLKVEYKPLTAGHPFGPNDAHVLVIGRKNESVKKHLKRNSEWVWPVHPDGRKGPTTL